MKTGEGRSRRQRGRRAGRCTRPMTASCSITLQLSLSAAAPGRGVNGERERDGRRRDKVRVDEALALPPG